MDRQTGSGQLPEAHGRTGRTIPPSRGIGWAAADRLRNTGLGNRSRESAQRFPDGLAGRQVTVELRRTDQGRRRRDRGDRPRPEIHGCRGWSRRTRTRTPHEANVVTSARCPPQTTTECLRQPLDSTAVTWMRPITQQSRACGGSGSDHTTGGPSGDIGSSDRLVSVLTTGPQIVRAAYMPGTTKYWPCTSNPVRLGSYVSRA